jgi:hypothetical protein
LLHNFGSIREKAHAVTSRVTSRALSFLPLGLAGRFTLHGLAGLPLLAASISYTFDIITRLIFTKLEFFILSLKQARHLTDEFVNSVLSTIYEK